MDRLKINKAICKINKYRVVCSCSNYERKNGCRCCHDNPNLFNKLTVQEQEQLCNWINLNLQATNNISHNNLTSYGIKHRFERSPGGFYITNGAFKGAMMFEGYKHSQGVNWYFNIKKI